MTMKDYVSVSWYVDPKQTVVAAFCTIISVLMLASIVL